MHIIFVKKILADGSPCKKCGEVLERMASEDQMRHIDEILVADEGDPESAGMVLARALGVDRAPFFVVTGDDGIRTVHTVYLKFVKEVLGGKAKEADELREILSNENLDFL